MSSLPALDDLSQLGYAWVLANRERVEKWALQEKWLRANGGGCVWAGEINAPHGHNGPTKFTRVEITREGE